MMAKILKAKSGIFVRFDRYEGLLEELINIREDWGLYTKRKTARIRAAIKNDMKGIKILLNIVEKDRVVSEKLREVSLDHFLKTEKEIKKSDSYKI